MKAIPGLCFAVRKLQEQGALCKIILVKVVPVFSKPF